MNDVCDALVPAECCHAEMSTVGAAALVPPTGWLDGWLARRLAGVNAPPERSSSNAGH